MNLDDRTSTGAGNSDDELVDVLGSDSPTVSLSSETMSGLPSDSPDHESASQRAAKAEHKIMNPPKGKGKGPQSFAATEASTSVDGNGKTSSKASETTPNSPTAMRQTGTTDAEPKAKPETVMAIDEAAHLAETGPIATFDLDAYVAPSEDASIKTVGDSTVEIAEVPLSATTQAEHRDTVAEPDLLLAEQPSGHSIGEVKAEDRASKTSVAMARDKAGANSSQSLSTQAMGWADSLLQRVPKDLTDRGMRRNRRVQSRKVRRVIRHIDPWSVLTFSVLFHLFVFASILLASVLVWNAAEAAGTIENIENFIKELGDYRVYEIHEDVVFRAAMLIAGILTLASTVLVVLLTVVFNLISDLIGGVRVTVVEEEVVRVKRNRNSVAAQPQTR